MTDKEKAIRWFEDIAYECDKLTSGNVAHLRAQIKGMAIRSAEYLKKQEPASEDLADAINNYCLNVRKGYPRIKDETDLYICEAFKAGVVWQEEQMMKDAVEAVVSQVPCSNEIIFRNPASVSYWYLPSEMNRLGINKGDKVNLIIIKG